MRIVMISPTVGEAFGQERIISQSVEGLTKLGHDVFLIAERQLDGHLTFSAGTRISSFLIPDLFSLPHLLTPVRQHRALKALKTYLAAIQPEIVHLVEQPHHRIINFLNENYPTVLTAHTVAPTCPASHRLIFGGQGGNQVCKQPSGWQCLKTTRQAQCLDFLKNEWHRWHALLAFQLKHRATQKLPRLIAISDYVRLALIQDGFELKKIKRIYNPVDSFSQITPLSGTPRPLIVSACRLVPLKGIHTALQALKELESLEWTYWICGAGPEEAALKAWVEKLGLQSRVCFKGQTGRLNTLRIIKSAQLFLQPNVGPEGFGLSVVEALSLGTPTIASHLPAFDELITDGQTGLLTPPGDFRALAETIKKLLRYPEIGENLSRQSQSLTPKYFSLDAFLKNTLDLYGEMLTEPVRTEVSEWGPKVLE